jgi:hypothetical protein
MADNTTTLFDLPNNPEGFGVVLTPAKLRRIDFSGLDFTTARRAIIEYIKTYYPDQFNDYVASNGIMMMTEIVASVVAKLSLRSDMLANEATLPTAKTERAVINHLALINQRIKRQTPAIVDIEISVDVPITTDIVINPGISFTANGPDNRPINYEVFKAPGDFTSNIIIPAGKRGVIAWGVQGRFATPVIATSSGGSNQTFEINDENILEDPLKVYVTYGSERTEWTVIKEPIEKFGSNDKVVEVNFFDNSAIYRFGDDVTGVAPKSGSQIEFVYRVGGGIRGRIGVNTIDSQLQITPLPPANAVVSVRFRNISASNGGTDKETIEQAKKRAPRDFSAQGNIVTSDDYAIAATNFRHPVFGSITKAVATIRTSKNANLIEIYALAEGPDGIPTAPNSGLKTGLKTYISDINVFTDHVEILDAELYPVDVEMNVIIDRNADASVIKDKVESAITEFFDAENWELGEGLYVSNLIEALEAIDGISYIDLFNPSDNILPAASITDASQLTSVKYNQLIVEGQRTTNYYYAKTFTTPIAER